MIRFVCTLAMVALLVGCGGTQQPAPKSPATQAPAADPTELPGLLVSDDLGDLEQGIVIQATLAEGDRPANADVQELVDMRDDVSLCATVNLTEPFPEELWVTVRVRPYRNFNDPPAALRVHVKRDDTTLATYGAVVGRLATGSEKAKELTWRVNVLEGLETMPDTTLIVADTELLLMPLGTVEETIDPMTADTEPSRKTTKPSNPLRINFKKSAGSPS